MILQRAVETLHPEDSVSLLVYVTNPRAQAMYEQRYGLAFITDETGERMVWEPADDDISDALTYKMQTPAGDLQSRLAKLAIPNAITIPLSK
jgi:hypothetical protein